MPCLIKNNLHGQRHFGVPQFTRPTITSNPVLGNQYSQTKIKEGQQ